MDKKLLGSRIKIARKDRGLTSEKLSELCDINATYLRQIESGAKTPSLPVFVLLCKKLNLAPTYLLVEALADHNMQGIDHLLELIQTATPSQLDIITAMISSALDVINGISSDDPHN